MKKLSNPQRKHLASMLGDAANLIMAAVVVSGILEKKGTVLLAILTLILYTLIVFFTTGLRRGA